MKRTIVIWIGVLICWIVASICAVIVGVSINNVPGLADVAPEIKDFLAQRSSIEKVGLFSIVAIVAGIVMTLANWMVMKLQEAKSPTAPSIAGLESGRRMRLIQQQVTVVNDRLNAALERSVMMPLDFEDASPQVEKPALDELTRWLQRSRFRRGDFWHR
jgi:hypothetical protein